MPSIKTEIILFIAAAAGAGLFVIRRTSRAALFRHRDEKRLSDLYHYFAFNMPVDMATFTELITLIGKCYGVAPGKLRAEDRFDGVLGKLDSWNLGGGAEDLQEKLEQERGIKLPDDRRLHTVQDLIEYAAANRNTGSANGETA